MDLYTPDRSRSLIRTALRRQGNCRPSARGSVSISAAEKIAVPGLRYRTALNLSYEGDASGEIAYTDAGGAPVLFCLTANGNADAPPPRNVAREGLSYATWSRGGKSYMFVARMPERQAADLAQTLVARF